MTTNVNTTVGTTSADVRTRVVSGVWFTGKKIEIFCTGLNCAIYSRHSQLYFSYYLQTIRTRQGVQLSRCSQSWNQRVPAKIAKLLNLRKTLTFLKVFKVMRRKFCFLSVTVTELAFGYLPTAVPDAHCVFWRRPGIWYLLYVCDKNGYVRSVF